MRPSRRWCDGSGGPIGDQNHAIHAFRDALCMTRRPESRGTWPWRRRLDAWGLSGSDPLAVRKMNNGMWRSLVAHLTGGQGVAGSNPVIPTKSPGEKQFSPGLRRFREWSLAGPLARFARPARRRSGPVPFDIVAREVHQKVPVEWTRIRARRCSGSFWKGRSGVLESGHRRGPSRRVVSLLVGAAERNWLACRAASARCRWSGCR